MLKIATLRKTPVHIRGMEMQIFMENLCEELILRFVQAALGV